MTKMLTTRPWTRARSNNQKNSRRVIATGLCPNYCLFRLRIRAHMTAAVHGSSRWDGSGTAPGRLRG